MCAMAMHNRLPDEEMYRRLESVYATFEHKDLKEGSIDNEAPIYITRRYFGDCKALHISSLVDLLWSQSWLQLEKRKLPLNISRQATAHRAVMGFSLPMTNRPKLTQYLFYLLGTETRWTAVQQN